MIIYRLEYDCEGHRAYQDLNNVCQTISEQEALRKAKEIVSNLEELQNSGSSNATLYAIEEKRSLIKNFS